jgi:hypothetical protein
LSGVYDRLLLEPVADQTKIGMPAEAFFTPPHGARLLGSLAEPFGSSSPISAKTRPFLQGALLDFGTIASGRREALNPMAFDGANDLQTSLAGLVLIVKKAHGHSDCDR